MAAKKKVPFPLDSYAGQADWMRYYAEKTKIARKAVQLDTCAKTIDELLLRTALLQEVLLEVIDLHKSGKTRQLDRLLTDVNQLLQDRLKERQDR